MNTSSLPRPAGGLPPCLYLVEVTPSRRGRTPGWRVQVTDIDGVAQLTVSPLPWRTVGPWRSTEEGALHVGISEAFELRSGHGLSGPLVVYSAGVMIVDERPGRDRVRSTPRAGNAPTCGVAPTIQPTSLRTAEFGGVDQAATPEEPITIDVAAMAATYATAATSRTAPTDTGECVR